MIGHLQQAEWVRRFGHYLWVYPATLAVSLVPIPGWEWWLLMGPVLALGLFWIFIANDAHDQRPLCPQCIKSWPTNASEMAELRWRWLWWYHFGAITQIVLLVIVLAGWLLGILPAATLTLFLIGMYVANGKSRRLHNNLKPWCRWCRRDDDDDDERAATPTPSESLS